MKKIAFYLTLVAVAGISCNEHPKHMSNEDATVESNVMLEEPQPTTAQEEAPATEEDSAAESADTSAMEEAPKEDSATTATEE